MLNNSVEPAPKLPIAGDRAELRVALFFARCSGRTSCIGQQCRQSAAGTDRLENPVGVQNATENGGPAPLEVAVRQIENVTVLSVSGEVDLATAPQLNESIDAALSATDVSGLIVDLTDVTFFASVGMTVLVEASNRVGERARFAVVAQGPLTARPLTLMGLHETFSIFTDLDAALAGLALNPAAD